MPNKAKRKKSRRSSDNPLAQARGNNQVSAEELWARKTGVGYDLFLEYYAQQPVGTVSTTTAASVGAAGARRAATNTTSSRASNASQKRPVVETAANNPTTHQQQGRGLSRAAKRRKKKKGTSQQQPRNSASPQIDGGSTTNNLNDGEVVSSSEPKPNEEHPLWKAVLSHQHLLVDNREDSLRSFFQAMAKPLPLTFRIRSTADEDLVQEFQKELQSINNKGDDKMNIRPVFQLLGSDEEDVEDKDCTYMETRMTEISKNMLVYQASCPKSALTTELKDLLLEYSRNGVLSRQELGSMLPVTALARLGLFRPNASRFLRCLDMCASPGSKTLQAHEMILRWPRSQPPVLVANDILQSRLDALQQAVQRSGVSETTQGIVYTSQDASKFELRVAADAQKSRPNKHLQRRGTVPTPPIPAPLLHFDVILCDVPCSGDGTCRKDRHILPQWTPAIGRQLHMTQVAILSRAVELLDNGTNAHVCYSTCSLNPVENEAVVAAVLHKFNNSQNTVLELVDWPGVPGMILRDGVSQWKVAHYQVDRERDDDDDDDINSGLLTWYDSFEEVEANSTDAASLKHWSPSMWPPVDAAGLNLSRCKRLLPQDQDSGGFFLALLRKTLS